MRTTTTVRQRPLRGQAALHRTESTAGDAHPREAGVDANPLIASVPEGGRRAGAAPEAEDAGRAGAAARRTTVAGRGEVAAVPPRARAGGAVELEGGVTTTAIEIVPRRTRWQCHSREGLFNDMSSGTAHMTFTATSQTSLERATITACGAS